VTAPLIQRSSKVERSRTAGRPGAPLLQRLEHGAGRALSGLVLASLAALAMGCGPFGYLKKVAVDASRAVGQAEKAGAKQYAPYEYWGAVTYLEQSKVMMAYSEYDRAFDYGDRARQLADEAKKKAARRESGKMRETADDKASETEKDAAGKASGAAAPEPAATGSAGGKVEIGGKAGGGQ
jgi:hypothetical protein